jgi:WD40 repeat protein
MENEDREPLLHDRMTGTTTRLHRTERTHFAALSPDSRWLATFSGRKVYVRDLQSGRDIAELDALTASSGLAFTPDNRFLVLTSNDHVQFVNTTSWVVDSRILPAVRMFSAATFHGEPSCVIATGRRR